MSGAGDGLSRHTFAGSGSIMCKDPIVRGCRIRLDQLVNGCIVVQVRIENVPSNLSSWLRQCQSLDFDGTLDSGLHLMVKNIDVADLTRSLAEDVLILDGYVYYPGYFDLTEQGGVESASRKTSCEVTNIRLSRQPEPIDVWARQARIQIDRLPDYEATLRLTSNLRTAAVLGRVTVELEEDGPEDQLDDVVRALCGLLTLAQRSLVWPVSQHWENVRGGIARSRYQEPVFYHPMMLRPLIPANTLAGFIKDCLEIYSSHCESWNLPVAQDYYVQAMSIHSAWPQSIGFFTALETLKHAFLRQHEKDNLEYYMSGRKFKKETDSQIKKLLRKNFEEFRNLSDDEKGSLSGKIGALNRRAYKVILRRMFEELNVSVDEDDLRDLVNLRNQIIHTGEPNRQNDSSGAALQAARVAGLVEKIVLLGILHYEGSFEPYDQALLPPCE